MPVTETPADDELAGRFDGFEGFELDMAELADLDRDEVVAVLPDPQHVRAVDRRASRRVSIDTGLAGHEVAAERALEKARLACDRLAEGVDVIATDDNAFAAFRFANRSMRTQRLRSIYALKRRRGEDVTFDDVEAEVPAKWRAFQLAFLLLNIPTVTHPDHEKRSKSVGSYADLLWFRPVVERPRHI